MPASLLRGRWHRVTLQKPARTADASGGAAVAWTNVATVWARIAGAGEKEVAQAQQLQARLTHSVTLRSRAGVDTSMRLTLGARIFHIHGVRDPGERHERLELLCEEGAPA